jgi:hypothetical protein
MLRGVKRRAERLGRGLRRVSVRGQPVENVGLKE